MEDHGLSVNWSEQKSSKNTKNNNHTYSEAADYNFVYGKFFWQSTLSSVFFVYRLQSHFREIQNCKISVIVISHILIYKSNTLRWTISLFNHWTIVVLQERILICLSSYTKLDLCEMKVCKGAGGVLYVILHPPSRHFSCFSKLLSHAHHSSYSSLWGMKKTQWVSAVEFGLVCCFRGCDNCIKGFFIGWLCSKTLVRCYRLENIQSNLLHFISNWLELVSEKDNIIFPARTCHMNTKWPPWIKVRYTHSLYIQALSLTEWIHI